MLGKPKFKVGDIVRFRHNEAWKVGCIEIVDEYGTWEDASDVSYDIMVTSENMLYKHWPECLLQFEKYYGDDDSRCE